ncbi:MAG TPA: TonB-dependent receptor, partial [Pseudomonadaceae bacterium]|nr:TonB-dependent receptor [Pseudomonadaceae bacterium]
EQLTAMAPGNLIEAFDQLPQFLNNESPQTQSNFAGAGGASHLNLRGIGVNRTLVLLDGRRMVSSNRNGAVDINLFPEAMIRRVEVVTGGASAAYGTDAVAGVTNFMLDTNFTGLETKVQGGVSERGHGEDAELSLSFGTGVGSNGHFIGSAEYYYRNGLDGPDFDWYKGWGLVTSPDYLATGQGPRQIVAPDVVGTTYTYGGLVNAPGSALHRMMFQPDGSATPFIQSSLSNISGGTGSQSIAPQYGGGSGDNVQLDRGGQGGYLPDNDRGNLFGHYEHELSPNLRVFAQGIMAYNRTNGVGNAPVMHSGWSGRIYSGNAFLPADVQAIMDAEGLESFGFQRFHHSSDLGRGRLETTNRTDSFTTGFEAEINDGFFAGWLVNGYYQYGRNENESRLIDFIRTDRIFQAMDSVIDPATGEIVCQATLLGHPDYADCVPLNLIGQGNASDAARDYVLGPDKVLTENLRQRFFDLSASGELWQGWGAGPISGAVGFSYREDSIHKVVGPEDLVAKPTPANDPARGVRGIPGTFENNPSIWQFSGAQGYRGDYNVKEYFAETLVPLVSGVTGFEQLDLSLAARWADYSGSGGIWAWKTGIDWQIYSDLRLRGTISRDIRAANLRERLDAQSQGASGDDPAFDNENYSFSQIEGGNPAVMPEEADTLTVGLVYQPSQLPGLSMAVDYYDIEIDGAIGLLGIQRIIDDCYAGAAQLCGQIERDPDSNRIIRVTNVFQNIAKANVNGVDMEASYNMDVNWFGNNLESLNLRLLGSYLDENSTTNPGAPKVDRAGDVGVAGLPRWRGVMSATYMNGPLTVFLQQRYVGEGRRNNDWVEGVDIDNNEVKSAWYTDLRAAYDFAGFQGGNLEIFGHVSNLFDKSPPVVAAYHSFTGVNQVNQRVHDVFGRRFTVGARYSY